LNDNTLRINDNLTIPRDELRFRYARSSGPGGQKVNRTASQVELLFDVAHSPSLTPQQRALIQYRLGGYIDSRGMLHLVSSATPSQWRNREEVIARFRTLVLHSLRVRRRRIPTRPSKAVKERRLQRKKRRSQTKRQRQRTETEEW